ncbi:hypothetical protein J2847_001028 [Azospirillum agricola]|nr:hypothetical protein [Azospirillum agricola]
MIITDHDREDGSRTNPLKDEWENHQIDFL